MEGSRIFRTFRRKMPYHTDQKKDLYFKAFRGRITSVLSKKEPMETLNKSSAAGQRIFCPQSAV